ncbi:MAG: hypothetical protein JWM56_498 [Candidatus Peribacteria bacterium]|nr:hypothetical protein [Candidatus Peribacteria bacterium]
MRRIFVVIGLEVMAVFLAVSQWLQGIHTDEAKYVLNIPYPHPPLARFILSLTDGWAYQELFWRIVFSTLVIQAVWLVRDMFKDRSREEKVYACAFWLLSPAVLLQAGSIMMAPLTALELLVFVWLYVRARRVLGETGKAGDIWRIRDMWIGLWWLASLFTAYQAVLFAPLAWAAFRRDTPWRARMAVVYVALPLLLLALYTFTNPLSLASMALKQGQGAAGTLADKLHGALLLWAFGGGVWAVLGIAGIFKWKQWELILTFLLITAYTALSYFGYYAILFTPLFVAGLAQFRLPRLWMTILLVLQVGLMKLYFLPSGYPLPGPARAVMQEIRNNHLQGFVLIQGSFGHDWQYESVFPIRRYKKSLEKDAQAVVCLPVCTEKIDETRWRQLAVAEPAKVYVKFAPPQ